MADFLDFSSELQRIFYTASQLHSNHEVEEYLEKECANDLQSKELVLRMLRVRNLGQTSQLDAFARQIRDASNAVGSVSSEQSFLDEERQSFPSIPRYIVKELLGEGAMGKVYLAEQLEPLRRHVALKVIKPGMDSARILARFEREKQTLALLNHANICNIYDAGITDRGYPYFSMELVDGNELDRYCQEKALSIEDRIRLVLEVASAVLHAHSRGVVHCDLKPANVLVKELDGQAIVKVIDFGIAKALSTDPSQSGFETYIKQIAGTPWYMSPEQIEIGATNIDERCDIYSLGALLYKLATAYEPLHRFEDDDTDFVTLQRLILEYVPPLASEKIAEAIKMSPETTAHRLGIPQNQLIAWGKRLRGDLEAVLDNALKKQATERYGSIAAFAADLQRFLECEPRIAQRSNRESTWVSHSKLTRLAIGLFATLLVAALALPFLPITNLTKENVQPIEHSPITSDFDSEISLRSADSNLEGSDRMLWRNRYLQAAVHVKEGNFIQANHDLNAIPKEYRNLEWRVEYEHLHSEKLVAPEVSEVIDIDVCSDGTLLAASHDKGNIGIWELRSGKKLHSFAGQTVTSLRHVKFSPNGKYLASAGFGPSVKIWSTKTGVEIADLKADFVPSGCKRIAFSSDSTILLVNRHSENSNGTVELWNIEGKAKVASYSNAVGDFSADRKYLILGRNSGHIEMISLETNKIVRRVKGHSGPIYKLNCMPDGLSFLTRGHDGTLKIWDIFYFECKYERHRNSFKSGEIEISPDSRKVITLTQETRALELASLNVPEASQLTSVGHFFKQVALFSDGRRIAVAGDTLPGISIRDLSRRNESRLLSFPNKDYRKARLSPNGRYVAIQYASKLCVYKISSQTLMLDLSISADELSWMGFSPNEDAFLYLDKSGGVTKRLLSDPQAVSRWRRTNEYLSDCRLSSNGTTIALFSDNGVTIHDTGTGKQLASFPGSNKTEPWAAFHPSKDLFAVLDDNEIAVFECANWTTLATYSFNSRGFETIGFSDDGKKLFTRGPENFAYWNTDDWSGPYTSSFQNRFHVSRSSLSVDATRIASLQTHLGKLDIFDTYDGRLLKSLALPLDYLRSSMTSLTPDRWVAGDVEFNTDGTMLFATLVDGRIAVWDAPNATNEDTLVGHEATVKDVAFNTSDTVVFSSDNDGKIRAWDFHTRKLLAVLDAHGRFGISHFAVSPDNTILVSSGKLDEQPGSRNDSKVNCIKIWDVNTFRENRVIVTPSRHRRIAFHPNSTFFATYTGDDAYVWDAKSFEYLQVFPLNRGDDWAITTGVAFCEDGNTIVVDEAYDRAKSWNCNDWTVVDNFDLVRPKTNLRQSRDGQWSLVPYGKNIRIINHNRQPNQRETERDATISQEKPFWHLLEAEASIQDEHWFSACFHLAQYLKSLPDDENMRIAFRRAYYRLVPEYIVRNIAIQSVLPSVVFECLIDSKTSTENAVEFSRTFHEMKDSIVSGADSTSISPIRVEFLAFARGQVTLSTDATDFYVLGLLELHHENMFDAAAAFECALSVLKIRETDSVLRLKCYANLIECHYTMDEMDAVSRYRDEIMAVISLQLQSEALVNFVNAVPRILKLRSHNKLHNVIWFSLPLSTPTDFR